MPKNNQYSMAKSLLIIFLFGMILSGFFIFVKFIHPIHFTLSEFEKLFKEIVYWPLLGLFSNKLLAPYIYIALGITLLLEYLIPANPKQKIFSVSFCQDSIWMFYETISSAFITIVYIQVIYTIFHKYLSFLTIKSVAEWPYLVRFALGVLLLDFLYWLQHYINHKVPWFWELHTVHHSQKEINFFTDFRYHTLEYFVRHTILVIPFLIFSFKTPTIIAYTIITTWYTRFYHGNIRTNLGPLRHIFVTPQSHRVHHSKLPQHRDLNFGSIFCIWDRIFKTQYYGYSEYPESGIEDTAFPLETKISPIKVIFMPLVQMTYPLVKIARKIIIFCNK